MQALKELPDAKRREGDAEDTVPRLAVRNRSRVLTQGPEGKKIAVIRPGSSPHIFLSSMLAHVGLDPRKNVEWITKPRPESVELLREGKVDAYMGFPPEPQELRARKIGHSVAGHRGGHRRHARDRK